LLVEDVRVESVVLEGLLVLEGQVGAREEELVDGSVVEHPFCLQQVDMHILQVDVSQLASR
jgi:hypothetical protein